MRGHETCEVAIVGGGPAGSVLAYHLAGPGASVCLFDSPTLRQKPCGGATSGDLLARTCPEAADPLEPYYRRPGAIRFLLSGDCQVTAPIVSRDVVVLDRRLLDAQLRRAAQDVGAKLVSARVVGVERDAGVWVLRTQDGSTTRAKLLVGADGAASAASGVRARLAGRVPWTEFRLARGVFVEGEGPQELTVDLCPEDGYAWAFSRHDHVSAGVLSPVGTPAAVQRSQVGELLERIGLRSCPAEPWAALVPCVTDPAFHGRACAGDGWLLVGDAAGHVDPLTGEGLSYAFRGAVAAAKAICSGTPQEYEQRWRDEFGEDLQASARLLRAARSGEALLPYSEMLRAALERL